MCGNIPACSFNNFFHLRSKLTEVIISLDMMTHTDYHPVFGSDDHPVSGGQSDEHTSSCDL